jgi:hypothetical protein
VCREWARFSFVREDLLFDEFADLNKLFREKLSTDTSSDSVAGAIRLYNLSAGSWSLAAPLRGQENVGSKADLLYSGNSFQIEAYAFQRLTGSGMQSSGGGNPTWKAGDSRDRGDAGAVPAQGLLVQRAERQRLLGRVADRRAPCHV